MHQKTRERIKLEMMDELATLRVYVHTFRDHRDGLSAAAPNPIG